MADFTLELSCSALIGYISVEEDVSMTNGEIFLHMFFIALFAVLYYGVSKLIEEDFPDDRRS